MVLLIINFFYIKYLDTQQHLFILEAKVKFFAALLGIYVPKSVGGFFGIIAVLILYYFIGYGVGKLFLKDKEK